MKAAALLAVMFLAGCTGGDSELKMQAESARARHQAQAIQLNQAYNLALGRNVSLAESKRTLAGAGLDALLQELAKDPRYHELFLKRLSTFLLRQAPAGTVDQAVEASGVTPDDAVPALISKLAPRFSHAGAGCTEGGVVACFNDWLVKSERLQDRIVPASLPAGEQVSYTGLIRAMMEQLYAKK